MVDKEEIGASLFSRTLDIMENDPLEEIFALNMGDFISEFLISEELAGKISKNPKNKTAKLKSQLQELIQANFKCSIKYETVKVDDYFEAKFYMDEDYIATGYGKDKTKAEQNCAYVALTKLFVEE